MLCIQEWTMFSVDCSAIPFDSEPAKPERSEQDRDLWPRACLPFKLLHYYVSLLFSSIIPFLLLLSRFSRVRLCDPMDCSLPGSSVHGIFQARVLEWVAIAFSVSSGTEKTIRCSATELHVSGTKLSENYALFHSSIFYIFLEWLCHFLGIHFE